MSKSLMLLLADAIDRHEEVKQALETAWASSVAAGDALNEARRSDPDGFDKLISEGLRMEPEYATRYATIANHDYRNFLKAVPHCLMYPAMKNWLNGWLQEIEDFDKE